MAQQMIKDVGGDVGVLFRGAARRHGRSGPGHLSEDRWARCTKVAVQAGGQRDRVYRELNQSDEVIGGPGILRRIPGSVEVQVKDRRQVGQRPPTAGSGPCKWRHPPSTATHRAISTLLNS